MARPVIEVAPSDQDSETARTASDALVRLINGRETGLIEVHLHSDDQVDETFVLPVSAVQVLYTVLHEMGKGHGVSIVPMEADLTENQAAGILRVSPAYLDNLLETGKIPFRAYGQERRIKIQDLLTYIRDYHEAADKALREMTKDAQASGLY